jgi:hypothetical protein
MAGGRTQGDPCGCSCGRLSPDTVLDTRTQHGPGSWWGGGRSTEWSPAPIKNAAPGGIFPISPPGRSESGLRWVALGPAQSCGLPSIAGWLPRCLSDSHATTGIHCGQIAGDAPRPDTCPYDLVNGAKSGTGGTFACATSPAGLSVPSATTKTRIFVRHWSTALDCTTTHRRDP